MKLLAADSRLQKALDLLCTHAPLYGDFSEISVNWLPADGSFCWTREGDRLTLRADSISDALCLLGRALIKPQENAECLTPRFSRLAAMVDLSRNSVYTVSTMKRFLCQLALMGFNTAYLYMEDTYELPGYPYFGYRRGRYSVAEQRELDDFANALGIELVPCIQTLAHLRTAIRWQYMAPMRDTVDNLMVGQEGTVSLVEAMIAHFSKTFRSRRIHLGMDEAVSLGTGRYLRHQGYRSHREIIMEHLQITCSLCKKYGLEPMIWDDMLFRDQTPLMNYYGDSAPLTRKKRPNSRTTSPLCTGITTTIPRKTMSGSSVAEAVSRHSLQVVCGNGAAGFLISQKASMTASAPRKHAVPTVYRRLW